MIEIELSRHHRGAKRPRFFCVEKLPSAELYNTFRKQELQKCTCFGSRDAEPFCCVPGRGFSVQILQQPEVRFTDRLRTDPFGSRIDNRPRPALLQAVTEAAHVSCTSIQDFQDLVVEGGQSG